MSGGKAAPVGPKWPVSGLARCPICTDDELVRAFCWFCGGLGYVSRRRRNLYKQLGRQLGAWR